MWKLDVKILLPKAKFYFPLDSFSLARADQKADQGKPKNSCVIIIVPGLSLPGIQDGWEEFYDM